MKLILNTLIVLFSFNSMLKSQEEILLYPNGLEESNELTNPETFQRSDFIINISKPRMYYYPAENQKKKVPAVLICPGGGYSGVSIVKEGSEVAKWFNKIGISAFVLYYRMPNKHDAIPLKDAQTAYATIQKLSNKLNINKRKIGVIGFSAGGHLASTVGTHYNNKKQRPSFMVLIYPVVTMNAANTHMGSRKNLLGSSPTDEHIQLYSNELQVKTNTPTTFILHANDDKVVPISNSRNFYDALKAKKNDVQLYQFDEGGHGFGMNIQNLPVDNWTELLRQWLVKQKLTK